MPNTSVEDRSETDREPTAAELAAIEAEQPVLVAEWALLDARLARPSRRALRRLRRAMLRLLAIERDRSRDASPLVSEWGWI